MMRTSFFMLFKTIIKIITDKFKSFKQKSLISLLIVKYIILHYGDRFEKGYVTKFEDKSFSQEVKSVLIAFIVAFFFYYFIIIELSILIFGYSLLCYGFLFLFLFILFIISWGLEVYFLKHELTEDERGFTFPEHWLLYYDGKTPYSLYDYITDYEHKPLFRYTIIDKNITDIEEGGNLLYTFFILFSITFFYFCSYGFWPWHLDFVAKSFYSVVNFFEIGSEPRLVDFYSTLIRFGNGLVFYLEYKHGDNPSKLKLLDKIPKATSKWEDGADGVWLNKISLRKTSNYGDIFFLGSLGENYALYGLVFGLEQPTELADGFDPNNKLFFLRYLGGQFDTVKGNYWVKYFKEDPGMWKFVDSLKEFIDIKYDNMEVWEPLYYFDEDIVVPSYHDIIMSQNYFDNLLPITNKSFFDYGAYGEIYDNFTHPKKKRHMLDFPLIPQFFTGHMFGEHPQSLFGLKGHYKQTKGKNEKYYMRMLKILGMSIGNGIYGRGGFTIENFKNMLFEPTINIPLYKYIDFAYYDKSKNFRDKDISISPKKELSDYLKKLDWRLSILEEKYHLYPMYFKQQDYNGITWSHLTTMLTRRVRGLDVYANKGNIFFLAKNQIPSWFEIKDALKKSFKPSGRMQKIYDKIQKTGIEIYELPDIETAGDLVVLEAIIGKFEIKAGLRTPMGKYYFSSKYNFRKFSEPTYLPWYIGSLKYFDSGEIVTPFPGFEGFYYPAPYPTPFATFGGLWFGYQTYGIFNASNFISESVSYIGDKSSSPTILYTGVEAIMYFRPVLKIFDIISNIFIGLSSYPIEFIATSLPMFFDKLPIVIFLVHLTWFLHFYIYLFLFLYVFYYFAKYYYYKSTYMWIYEGMFETAFINQNNGYVYWYNLTDIWSNYKNPYQFTILSLQTSLLLSYAFKNYINFIFSTKIGFIKFFNFLSIFFNDSQDIINYFKYSSDKLSIFKNILNIDNFKYFKFFYNINYKKYTMLLYEGGSECNSDFLIWDYYDYLCQTSIFLSRGLVKNIYLINVNKSLLTLIKHTTILFSSQSLMTNFFFLSMPLLDTSLSGKLLNELFYVLEFDLLNEQDKFFENYLYNLSEASSIFNYGLSVNLRFNFFNFFSKKGNDFYKIFNSKELNYLSKTHIKNFWDTEKYWLFAFFGSFRFVPKTRYPYINLSLSNEINGLQLRRVAYANSWIGSTINVGPFFNLVQHVWWTSGIYNGAFSITDNYINFNLSGIGISDNVRNFLEKGYSFYNQTRTETIFGVVGSLFLILGGKKKNGYLSIYNNPNINFDLTYSSSSIDSVTTNGLYDKTNPPLNLLELNITPHRLFEFFKNISPTYIYIYLTFFEQLELIDYSTHKLLLGKLKNEYSTIRFFNIQAKMDNPKLLSKFDFYLKKFDNNLKLNKKNKFSNWIFSFDISFFFNHFMSHDYLNTNNFKTLDLDEEIKKNKLFFILKNQSFSDINAKFNIKNHWFEKPFGVLDKIELIGMQKYKSIKDLDFLSITSHGENPYTFVEKETLKKISGQSILDFEDKGTSSDSYDEKFVGERSNGFIFNNPISFNTPGPLILGWVGELYFSTIDSTSMLFSILYSANDYNPLSFGEKDKFFFSNMCINYKNYFYKSYFSSSHIKKKLYSGSFSWLNMFLYPTAFRNFFGLKSISGLDYWSWKCGLQLDYGNGFYNYGPYLGMGHSFGSKLMVFDSMYGFYGSYGQIEDDPTMIDLDTDAMEHLYEDKDGFDDTPMFNYKDFYDVNNVEDQGILGDLSLPYREIYFSFHHPYFLGYFLFWFYTFLIRQQYLGLVNYSFKGLILGNFQLVYNQNINLDYDVISNFGDEYENTFGKYMYGYGLYFINPIQLTTKFSSGLHKETNLITSNEEQVMYVFEEFSDNINFLKQQTNFNSLDVNSMFEYKIIDLQLLNINWYNLDMPFPLNPYIAINNNFSSNFNINYEKIYHQYFLNFSHHDSLRENINFNIFVDDYLGSYLDSFNFISYYGTYGALSTLPEHFLDKPNYLATHNLGFGFDGSFKMAENLFYKHDSYDNHDMITGFGLVFQNISFISFFSSTLFFIFKFSLKPSEYNFFGGFLELYVKDFEFAFELFKLGQGSLSYEEGKYSPIVSSINSYFSTYKHSFFLFQICGNIPYDLLHIWLDLGILFFSNDQLKGIFKLKKMQITNGFIFLKGFYDGIGYQLYIFFFKK